MTTPFRRELPPRANLAQQKTQARELLQAFTRSDINAVTRVRAILPDKPRIVLADAQFVLARAYGFHDRRDELVPAGIAPPTGTAVPMALEARERVGGHAAARQSGLARSAIAPEAPWVVDPP